MATVAEGKKTSLSLESANSFSCCPTPEEKVACSLNTGDLLNWITKILEREKERNMLLWCDGTSVREERGFIASFFC